MRLELSRFVKWPVLPVLAGILSVLAIFRPVAYRVSWLDLGVPILVSTIWALVVWTALYYTPIIKRLTRPEAGLASAAIVLVTMAWMDLPSSLFAACLTWGLLVVIVMSKPSWQVWYNRIGTWWIIATLCVLMASSGIASAQRIGTTNNNDNPGSFTDALPSIYFIIPDRFTSIDALGSLGEDPSGFVQRLEDMGFYVRRDAMSHDTTTPESSSVQTTRTLRFLASELNGGEYVPRDIPYNVASRMVKQSTTIVALKELGYEFCNIGSWFAETKALAIANRNYSYKGYDLMSLMYGSEFSVAVVDRSILRNVDISPFLRISDSENTVRRAEHLYQKDTILELAEEDGHSKFVMTHLILPHPPFVWSAEGGDMPPGLPLMESYLQQVEFTEDYLVGIVSSVLEYDPNAIIIVQSDEGILFTNPKSNVGLTEAEWNGVLTAWRIPLSGNTTMGAEELDALEITDILGFAKDCVSELTKASP